MVAVDAFHDLGDLGHLPFRRSPTRGDQADRRGAGLYPGLNLGVNLVWSQPAVAQDRRVRPHRLRAVAAVLRAHPGLQVDQVVQFHGDAEEASPDPAGGGHQGHHLAVGYGEDLERLLLADRLATQTGLHQLFQIHRDPLVIGYAGGPLPARRDSCVGHGGESTTRTEQSSDIRIDCSMTGVDSMPSWR